VKDQPKTNTSNLEVKLPLEDLSLPVLPPLKSMLIPLQLPSHGPTLEMKLTMLEAQNLSELTQMTRFML